MLCITTTIWFGCKSIQQDYQLENSKVDGRINTEIPNPLALNLYTCGYNNQKFNSVKCCYKYKKNYISYHRLLTDAVNIKDAHIVNIGVNF